jgi:hypothetical protein
MKIHVDIITNYIGEKTSKVPLNYIRGFILPTSKTTRCSFYIINFVNLPISIDK